jgi:hypothetical protein
MALPGIAAQSGRGRRPSAGRPTEGTDHRSLGAARFRVERKVGTLHRWRFSAPWGMAGLPASWVGAVSSHYPSRGKIIPNSARFPAGNKKIPTPRELLSAQSACHMMLLSELPVRTSSWQTSGAPHRRLSQCTLRRCGTMPCCCSTRSVTSCRGTVGQNLLRLSGRRDCWLPLFLPLPAGGCRGRQTEARAWDCRCNWSFRGSRRALAEGWLAFPRQLSNHPNPCA